MTSAKNQPFSRKHNINIGYYDGLGVYPRNITERNTTLKLHENRLCLVWKSDGVSFNKAIKESKDNFEVVDNFISDKHVKSFVE